eukprot:5940530-Prymnesium_polylepis.1
MAGGLVLHDDIHTYGSGPDQEQIRAEVEAAQLPVIVHNGIDHAHPSLHGCAKEILALFRLLSDCLIAWLPGCLIA